MLQTLTNTLAALHTPQAQSQRWEDTSRIPSWARETVHTVPAHKFVASWPLPLPEAPPGSLLICPSAGCGLPPEAPWRNREKTRCSRCRKDVRFGFWTVMLHTGPHPLPGWAGSGAQHPPTWVQARGWLAGSKGLSPHRQLCALAHPPSHLSSSWDQLTCYPAA